MLRTRFSTTLVQQGPSKAPSVSANHPQPSQILVSCLYPTPFAEALYDALLSKVSQLGSGEVGRLEALLGSVQEHRDLVSRGYGLIYEAAMVSR